MGVFSFRMGHNISLCQQRAVQGHCRGKGLVFLSFPSCTSLCQTAGMEDSQWNWSPANFSSSANGSFQLSSTGTPAGFHLHFTGTLDSFQGYSTAPYGQPPGNFCSFSTKQFLLVSCNLQYWGEHDHPGAIVISFLMISKSQSGVRGGGRAGRELSQIQPQRQLLFPLCALLHSLELTLCLNS